MEIRRAEGSRTLQDSGHGSFGSESDTSPVQTSNSELDSRGGIQHVLDTHNIDGTGDGPAPQNTLPSKRRYQVVYYGECELDRRYTAPMLPWVMAEVRRANNDQIITIDILQNSLKATSCDTNEVLFEHKLHTLSRFARSQQDHACFAYLTRNKVELPFVCHVFLAFHESQVQELFGAIREATKESACQSQMSEEAKDAASNQRKVSTSLFEILYVGKVLVNTKKAPPTFIDEAVDKFCEYESKRTQEDIEEARRRHSSGTSVRSLPSYVERHVSVAEDGLARNNPRGTPLSSNESISNSDTSGSGDLINASSLPEGIPLGASGGSATLSASLHLLNLNVGHQPDTPKSDSHLEASAFSDSVGGRSSSVSDESVNKEEDSLHKLALQGQSRKNRTMLIQIGQGEVCLVSPDKKSVIFERKFKDISFCSQGINNPKHFGFIARDLSSNHFVCYVFRCAAESVVEEVMQTLHTAFQQSAKNHIVCELCPMHQLNKLCQEVDKLPPEKVNEILFRRIEQLGEKDHAEIMHAFKVAAPSSVQRTNEVLMSILRRMCEEKQGEHIHLSDSNKNHVKYDFILTENNKNVLSNFATKAKKSLTSSFEQFMRITARKEDTIGDIQNQRRRRRDSEGSAGRSFESEGETPETTPVSSPTSKDYHFNFSSPFHGDRDPPRRPRSATVPDLPTSPAFDHVDSSNPHHVPDSSIKQMFRRVGYNNDSSIQSSEPVTSSTEDCSSYKGSWRLGILNRVVTPAKNKHRTDHFSGEPLPASLMTSPRKSTLSPQKIRALWRKAILETLLLIRMEKENRTLQARQDEVEVKRIKLDYEEITPCLKMVTKIWDAMLVDSGGPVAKVDGEELTAAVKDGVPRSRRGEIWHFCVKQHKVHYPALHKITIPRASPYEELLKQLTMHQHAILIDLGRTFPSHPFFSTQLGPGQLSLFNLLKAYSLLDKEVGYCQGLSFVAGILLMHMPEETAFETMKHMMFTLGFRKQYRPDMVALQIQMYQLSRLLHDKYRDLYDHLERFEIAPTLYAAPWFLTLFASQFPLGFVARVFDLIFLQGMEVVFKVALVLLGNHKELVKQCDSFETVVEFLKTTLPSMGIIQMERIINQVFAMDLSRQLHAYEVEYHVLQEEMMMSAANREGGDLVAKLEATNLSLKKQKLELLEQLQVSHSHNHTLEAQINSMQSNANKLKSHIRTLELERGALLNTVSKLRRLVPTQELEKANICIPASPTLTLTHSPIHNPLVERFFEEGVVQMKTNSLADLDKEVAAYMESKKAECHHHSGNRNTLSVMEHVRERPASSDV